MAINRINDTDLRNKLVSQLSNRPTDPRSAGGDNMTAQEVKARHDALGLLVKDKLNELLDALNNATVGGEPVTPLSDLITVVADGVSKSLTAWIEEKYSLPLTGVPYTDLSAGVKESLDLADSAYQLPETGIPADDLASAVKTILTNALLQSDADMSATGGKLGRRDYSGVLHGATYGASAIGTALVNKEQFEPVKALALGATKAFSVENYTALVTALSSAEKTAYRVGQTIFVGTEEVPDVWVYSVEDSSVSYTYTTDSALEASLVAGTLQIGYFTLRQMETKTDLSDYATTDAVSEAIDALIDALVDGVMAVAEATYAESATYAQQADLANQINTDREIEDADTACPPTVFGTVGGNAEVQSGLMPFTELRGHTIKWNQLVQNGNFDGTTGWGSGSGSISASDNIGTLLATAQNGQAYYDVSGLITGHQYLVVASLKLTTGTTDVRLIGNIGNAVSAYTASNTTWQMLSAICTASGATGSIIIRDGRSSDWDAIQIKNVMLLDLTDIYGAGKEPTTVEEFVRDYPKPYYPYNAGTPLSSKSSSVDFVKRNQWDEEWEVGAWVSGQKVDTGTGIRSKNIMPILPGTTYYCGGPTIFITLFDANGNYISRTSYSNDTFVTDVKAAFFAINSDSNYGTTYKHDICIYINWETPGLPYVPYSKQHITLPNIELRSAGSAYDVAYQQGGGKRRIGVVDLGTIAWEVSTVSGDDTSIHRFVSTGVIAKGVGGEGTALGNGICSHYDLVTNAQSYTKVLGIAITQTGRLSVYDPSKNTMTSSEFKAAMDGVMLYYELATETDITVEENPGWTEYAEIDNFGTVKFNQDPAQTIPVPQAYFIRYTVNLVEFLDSLYVHCGGDVTKIALVE